ALAPHLAQSVRSHGSSLGCRRSLDRASDEALAIFQTLVRRGGMADAQTDKPAAEKETYDDQPFHAENLPPEIRAPLAPFKGAEPPSPQWFKDAIAQEPERSFVTSLGAKIELLTWGEVGKPGLLLVHGNSAHADWWSF